MRKFNKVLVANRGEIAVRIIRTLKDMGIKSVAIFSDVDRESLHTRIADESICIGPRNAKESYLNKVQILNAAIVTGADAIHPCFGFLSENSSFAKMCEIYNIKFIGPTSKVMEKMGNKDISKKIMKEAGIPVVPGSDGVVDSLETAKAEARNIGYPVIIKARSGGGGKGMRVVKDEEDFNLSFQSAKKEAENAFGDGGLYIEKYIESPRHIEVQILADELGNVVHLSGRDCTIQMNHQKVIEEAPPTAISQDLLEELYDISIKAAKAVGYTNAGTIEYLVSSDDKIYFMEMNTRIQVEHPVTEMITGIDIVKEQINIASGNKLEFTQEDIEIKGHSLECRINAYDSENGFLPSSGVIEALNLPGGYGVRIDSSIYQGYNVLPFYDSMLAKIISFGKDREDSINIMLRALDEFVIEGVKTNINFNKKILTDKNFLSNDFSTNFLSDDRIESIIGGGVD
ncbi:acetyl-CoA carboxylase biotin carboxylase subunit [Peptostreptococcus porci]|uniref:acetyl-CoA carboxylase biotin carboxylase subunit n=1 Tax=Peptostreptococcus porci TaxID=2652282 RepID=UPI002A91F2EC|nr:acetyl-CoA carboxylase biotin carboxylase subunit [Peptostreptococcus porci]MDY5436678.1 acetyl-CoA carboxylase biotin carboxylase subunit [Peptostreptococcus porci]